MSEKVTCGEAIKNALQAGVLVTYQELVNRVELQGDWTPDTISQMVMARIANLPPARVHYSRVKELVLWMHEDGRFELYDENIHWLPSVSLC